MAKVTFGSLPVGARFRFVDSRAAVVTQALTKVSAERAVITVAWYDVTPATIVAAED